MKITTAPMGVIALAGLNLGGHAMMHHLSATQLVEMELLLVLKYAMMTILLAMMVVVVFAVSRWVGTALELRRSAAQSVEMAL